MTRPLQHTTRVLAICAPFPTLHNRDSASAMLLPCTHFARPSTNTRFCAPCARVSDGPTRVVYNVVQRPLPSVLVCRKTARVHTEGAGAFVWEAA